MLILSQRPRAGRDAVYITTPDGIEILVVVLSVTGNQVRIGYEAPKSVRIDRAEIHQRRQLTEAGEVNGNIEPK